MSIATKLAKLKTIKQDIKSALEEKGQTPSNVFSTYANNIRAIETGGNTLKTLLDATQSSANLFNNYKGTSVNDLISYNDTSNVTDMHYMFSICSNLTSIPQLNTSKVTTTVNMFYNCYSLTTIPQLDTSRVTDTNRMFYSCYSLTTLGGLLNLGQAYSTTSSANNSSYKLDLSTCTALAEQSLINVLTNLYDIATKGCKTQQVILGSTNLAKLVSEEGQQALSSATEKGWNIS